MTFHDHPLEDFVATRVSKNRIEENGEGDEKALAELLLDLEGAITDVVHLVNNPLTVISGNAQFLAEMIREDDAAGELKKSVSDIEDASRDLAERLRLLTSLKEEVKAAVEGLGRGA